jgi:hypothetical protein
MYFGEWFSRLKDPRAKAKIAIRLDRLALGKFGDCKRSVKGFANSESIGDLGIGCTTRCWARHACFCLAAAIRNSSLRILSGRPPA